MSFVLDDPKTTSWIYERLGPGIIPPAGALTIGWSQNNVLVAGLSFHSIVHRKNIFVDIALAQKRFPPALLRFGLRYPLEQLQIPRLTFCIDSTNLASKGLVRSLGATREATLSCAARHGDLEIWVLWLSTSAFCRRFLSGRQRQFPRSTELRQADSAARSIEPAAVQYGPGRKPADYLHTHRHNVLDPDAWRGEPLSL